MCHVDASLHKLHLLSQEEHPRQQRAAHTTDSHRHSSAWQPRSPPPTGCAQGQSLQIGPMAEMLPPNLRIGWRVIMTCTRAGPAGAALKRGASETLPRRADMDGRHQRLRWVSWKHRYSQGACVRETSAPIGSKIRGVAGARRRDTTWK